MKKVLFALVGMFLFTVSSYAQEVNGPKLAKSAGKALAAFNQDPGGNKSKLEEARNKIEEALKTPEAQALPSAWIIKGDIYSTRLMNELAMQSINPNATLSGDNDAVVAFEAFKKAYDMPEIKKYEKSQVIDGVVLLQPQLINMGVGKYSNKVYEKAYVSFKAALDAHDMLSENKKKSLFDEKQEYNDQVYFTGLMASLAKRYEDALPMYELLYKQGTDSVQVYEDLYNTRMALKDEEGALSVMKEGRKKFPKSSSLLFAEINYYIIKERLNDLTGSLEQAIAQEPENASLYRALGDVYNSLFAKTLEDTTQTREQKAPKMKEYADMAKKNFKAAIEKEPNNTDFNYSLGALLYNETNTLAQEMNATSFATAAGQKRYKELKAQMLLGVEDAIEYFQKAESLDPNDPNTLAALIQAYGRKEDEALYMEFKKRLDVVKAGGTNPVSYFKN